MVQMSSVWDRTAAFVSAALGQIIPIALVLLFVPVSIQLAIAPVVAKQAVTTQLSITAILWAIQLLGTLGLTVLALGGTRRPGAAVRAALARLGPTIAISLMLIGAGIVLFVPIAVIVANAGVDFTALQAPDQTSAGHIGSGAGWFLLLYGLVLFVFIVWVTARLLVIAPVILAERRGIGAITRAFSRTRGLALKIVGVMILYAIVATIAVGAAKLMFGSIFSLIAPNDGDIGVATVLTAIVTGAVATAFKALAAIFVAKLYQAIGDANVRTLELA